MLLCVGLTAVADGLAQGALYAEAAELPPKFTQVPHKPHIRFLHLTG